MFHEAVHLEHNELLIGIDKFESCVGIDHPQLLHLAHVVVHVEGIEGPNSKEVIVRLEINILYWDFAWRHLSLNNLLPSKLIQLHVLSGN